MTDQPEQYSEQYADQYEADLTRLTCLNCRTLHDANDLYCMQCGCILGHNLKGSEKTNLLTTASTTTGTPLRVINLEWGTSYFHPRAHLSLYHVELRQTIPIPLSVDGIILGRNIDDASDVFDLTQYGATEYGISRRHLKITRLRGYLQIADLNSSNGTFLNKTQLMPDIAYTLRNRAVLQMGHMILRVQFT